MNKKIQLVLIDDHSIITDGISSFFENDEELEVIAAFNSPLIAMEKLKELNVDVILTDLSMPEMSGQQIIRTVKKEFPSIKVIVLSMFADKALIAETIYLGANGYTLKNSGKEELFACIKKVYEGGTYFPFPIDEELAGELNDAGKNSVSLSARELEILKLVSEGYNSKQIADKIFLSEFTVNTHRRNMLRKTNQPNVAALLTLARQRHWID